MHSTSRALCDTPSLRLEATRSDLEKARSLRLEPPHAWLRHAARSSQSTRPSKADVCESPWQELVSGRWSPVDTFENGGTHYVIAHRNGPQQQEQRALTRREQDVLLHAARGVPNKCIAYDLEIAQSSVSLALARARAKLRMGSSADLARLLWVLMPASSENTSASTGRSSIEGQEYLTFSRRQAGSAPIARLTPSERAVFEAVINGHSTARIAANREISPRTLANQLASIFLKLRVGSRSELRARFAHCYREGAE